MTVDVNISDELKQMLVDLRRDFHRHAETAWTEFRTASKVVRQLEQMGYEVSYGRDVVKEEARMGVPPDDVLQAAADRALSQGGDPEVVVAMAGGFTGVVAVLETGKAGPTVAFRFDMDANDISEEEGENHVPFQEGFGSVNEGAMHACGHDAHTAMGLVLARWLQENRDSLAGRVKLIFQPAEEGVRGARAMAEAGVVDDVDYLLGLHVGLALTQSGQLVAGARGFLATSKADVTFTGAPAHAGAQPEAGRNALVAAAVAIPSLLAISRHSEGPTRVNVGTLTSGTGRNVIPASAKMTLETRGGTTQLNEYVWNRAREVLEGAAQMQGVDVEIEAVGAARGGESSPQLARRVAEMAGEIPQLEQVEESGWFGGSEDFTYLMERVQERGGQATYVVLGSDLAGGHHNPAFDLDESVMSVGVHLLARAALALTRP